MIVLCGEAGSGKFTLINVLCGDAGSCSTCCVGRQEWESLRESSLLHGDAGLLGKFPLIMCRVKHGKWATEKHS